MTNLGATTLLGIFCQTPKSTSIDFTYWKWVVLVGVAAVVVFYVLKRISDIVVDRKTDKLIREIEREEDSKTDTTKGSD